MVQVELEIVNKLGLHARASAKFTQLASKYASEVWVMRNNKRVNGKSIMGVMMLAAGKGSRITLETTGTDEQECSTAIATLIAEKFGEGSNKVVKAEVTAVVSKGRRYQFTVTKSSANNTN